MSTETAEYPAATKTLGDQIAGLTLKDAKILSDYLKDVYGIEPAAGGAVVMAAGGGGGGGAAEAVAEKTEFDVVLEGSGIDEKFLGVTLFALVPNTTEFMNAISFAMNGNIALR